MNLKEQDEFSLKFKEKTGQEFSKFYQKHKPKLVWHLTNYYTKDIEKSEDFADEAFIQGLEKIDTYDNVKSQIHTWMYKIAENIVKRDFKEKQRLNLTSLDFCLNDDELNLKKLIPYDDGLHELENQFINTKKAKIVEDLIYDLPEKYRHVLVLREIEKMSYLEIAENTRKKYIINSSNTTELLEYPEEFWLLSLKNEGSEDFRVKITLETDEVIVDVNISKNNSYVLKREDINDKLTNTKIRKVILISNNTKISGEYIATTNLSTIKSQILKGRQIIKQKSKKKFKKVDDLGINMLDF